MDALKTFIRPLEKKLYHFHVFFLFFRILNIFNTHTRGEGRRFLKKFTVVYIQKGLIPLSCEI